jgi:hypothetical protein
MKTEEMQPGDVRLFKKGNGNAVVLAIGSGPLNVEISFTLISLEPRLFIQP